MNSIEKDKYFRTIERTWRGWSRLLFLSSQDMNFVEDLWEQGVPLEVVLSSIQDGFTSIFKRKKKRIISLRSLKRRIDREMELRRRMEAGKGLEFKRKTTEVGGEFKKMLDEAMEKLNNGDVEGALSIDEEITRRIWTSSSKDEREEVLNWARERVKELKAPQETKDELILNGAMRRLRERKGIPFLF